MTVQNQWVLERINAVSKIIPAIVKMAEKWVDDPKTGKQTNRDKAISFLNESDPHFKESSLLEKKQFGKQFPMRVLLLAFGMPLLFCSFFERQWKSHFYCQHKNDYLVSLGMQLLVVALLRFCQEANRKFLQLSHHKDSQSKVLGFLNNILAPFANFRVIANYQISNVRIQFFRLCKMQGLDSRLHTTIFQGVCVRQENVALPHLATDNSRPTTSM